MCGIFGYFDRSGNSLPRADLERMGVILRHRGPDDDGIFSTRGVALGNRRLAIIDPESGIQPMLSDDGRIAVVQNGEIYNYVELQAFLVERGIRLKTNSDTEIILRLYEFEGIECLHRLNGMFAIAIYDDDEKQLFLARDRLGVKPLFIHDDGTRLIFASEIKGLLATGIRRELNREAVPYFLTFGYVPHTTSIFADVTPVAPGTYLRISADGTKTHRWWRLENAPEKIMGEEAWIETLLDRLSEAVRIRLRADVPFGAFLSGGIDSSTVVGLAGDHLDGRLKTFTISFPDKRFDESEFAQFAADRFGTDHYCKEVNVSVLEEWPSAVYFSDQPHGDSSFIPMRSVSNFAAQHVKMVLTGDGGDELHAGYNKYLSLSRTPGFLEGDPHTLSTAWIENLEILSREEQSEMLTPEFCNTVRHVNASDLALDALENCSRMDSLNQVLFLDTTFLLPGNNLVKPDRMAMAEGLEARSPFLDFNFVRTSFDMPGALKLRDGQTKYLLKRAVRKLLGDCLVDRQKQQFTMPIGDWFRSDQTGLLRRLLLGNRTTDRGIFNRGSVERKIEEHLSHQKNHTRLLRSLVALELWHRTFIDALWTSPPTMSELCP